MLKRDARGDEGDEAEVDELVPNFTLYASEQSARLPASRVCDLAFALRPPRSLRALAAEFDLIADVANHIRAVALRRYLFPRGWW